MTVKHWHDKEDLGKRLAAHNLSDLLSIDLEGSQRIGKIGAIRADRATTFTWSQSKGRGSLSEALVELDQFAVGARYLVGHNIIEHDVNLLASHASDLQLLKLPAIDTLYLSPLAFPENPYHHLVKQYKEPALARVQINDPLLDAELALELLADVSDALKEKNADLLSIWHALLATEVKQHAFDYYFRTIRHVNTTPNVRNEANTIKKFLQDYGCPNQASSITQNALSDPLALTYLTAWLPVSGGNSIIAPYIEHRFQTSHLATALRDTRCQDRNCSWCAEKLNAEKALQRWFGFPSFRKQPQSQTGESLQQSIVEQHLARKHVLGILPTGTGKSLCYQLPALMRYEATGAITVVISPLVALMADQVAAMRRQGITCAATINGLLSMPERSDALDHIRLGDAGIILVAPEQLRNRSFRKAIAGRRIGAWVIDEAHCLSKWGHDFRPDYRYVARYIFEHHKDQSVPILCLTATAKRDVIKDIQDHFKEILQAELEIIDGGSERQNLKFVVMPTTASQRIEHIHLAIKDALEKVKSGGAIVYCTTKKNTEETAQALANRGLSAQHFHSGLSPERKRDVQRSFHDGEIDVVVATNAFGMGIDKPDVRAVIHAEIPGSLENYLQEAGRAGRDGHEAQCLLLFEPSDTEKQFSLTAHARLKQRDIQTVLRAIRNLDRRRLRHNANSEDPVIATAGEILLEDQDGEFVRDNATDDNRVRTAIAWLEESKIVRRDENYTTIYPSSLRIPILSAAQEHINRECRRRNIRNDIKTQMLCVVKTLMHANVNSGISTDELMSECGCTHAQLRTVFSTLEEIGVASNDMRITVYVHVGVQNYSDHRLRLTDKLEQALITELREEAPDQEINEWSYISLRHLAQRLRKKEITDPLPERLVRILRSIAADGKDEPDAKRSIDIRARDMETIGICLRRSWNTIERLVRLRREGATLLLGHLTNCVPSGVRGVDLLVETTYGALGKVIDSDLALKAQLKEHKSQPLVDRALLWMHEQEVITLSRGLTVFRPAMSLKVSRDGRNFTRADFKPLQEHYAQQTAQIHIVNEYAKLGVDDIHQARRLAIDYFKLTSSEFIEKWFKDKEKILRRDTLPEDYAKIVDELGNPTQASIVADNRENTNVLVLAGPGSGKTRVLVHRIAYLLRVRRELPNSILALTYNRHSAVEVRQRLLELVGNDAHGVRVMTCHALAMRILGITFEQNTINPGDDNFDKILCEATELLQSDGESSFISREQMIGRLNWILVDEYQDIGQPEYELIAALAGKTLAEDGAKLNLFAVGDDDQNIYAWKGTSVDFIRRFGQEYKAKTEYLVENYRSSQYIIDAANQCIKGATQRLKGNNHEMRINSERRKSPPGGRWTTLDKLARGKVQILHIKGGLLSQAVAAVEELKRLSVLDADWQWSRCAIIARNWDDLEPVDRVCRAHKIPVQIARNKLSSFWRARETQAFLNSLKSDNAVVIQVQDIRQYQEKLGSDLWSNLLAQALDELLLEEGQVEMLPISFVIHWLGEWSQEIRQRQRSLLLTSAHGAKGLEFDHVVILDGKWNEAENKDDPDTQRRLYYVAMTRARETLALVQLENANHPNIRDQSHASPPATRAATLLQSLKDCPSVLERNIPPPDISNNQYDIQIKVCNLEEIVLSFAGRRSGSDPVHRAIAELAVGDQLSLSKIDDRWFLLDRQGRKVGQMSSKWAPPSDAVIIKTSVYGIFTRSADETKEEEYKQKLQSEKWEIVLPQFTQRLEYS